MPPVRQRTLLVYILITLVALTLGTIALITAADSNQSSSQVQATLLAAQNTGAAIALELSATLPPTATPSITPSATNTPTATATNTVVPTDTPSNTPTVTPTTTTIPTDVPTTAPTDLLTAVSTSAATNPPTILPTATVTSTNTPIPTVSASVIASEIPSPFVTLTTGTPAPAGEVSTGTNDIFNILLLGSDQRHDDPAYRTDTIIVVSINRSANTVNMLSIPRDLWLYIPGYDGYNRINTASVVGDGIRWPGLGAGLLSETIARDLGIRIDRWAKINFENFSTIVDDVDGIDIAVDCPLLDFGRAWPDFVPVGGNSRMWVLPVGYYHMDGTNALFFARSRETTSDFDRNRRQQLVLRAIWHKAQAQGLINKLPDLWDKLTKLVQTNLTLSDMVGLLPVALAMDGSRMHSYFLGPGQVTNWTTPDGADVLLPQPGPIKDIVTRLYTPPTKNQLVLEAPSLDVFDGTGHKDYGKVAVSRLSWEGFQPTEAGTADPQVYPDSVIYDLTGGAKPASLKTLQRILNVKPKNVIAMPNPDRTADFKVVLGVSYNSCTYSPFAQMNQN